MIEEEEIVEIIQKKLTAILTSEESNKLNKWLEKPTNAASYKQYIQLWDGTASIADKQEAFSPNSSKSWQSIEQHIVADNDKPTRKFKLAYMAAASVALLFVIFGVNSFLNTNTNIQYALEANEKDTLTFSDGSQAYLFGPCSISYPETFASNERIISMDGFVYFDIAHDETRPFEINTDNGSVEVLGTTFTVDTRQNETFTVQCISGKVRMTAYENGTEFKTILTKNLKGTYELRSDQLVTTPFELADMPIKVPARNMSFNNSTLAEILERIEYSYDVSIQVENKDLLETRYSTTINDSTLDDFLNELKITYNVDIVQTASSNYILKGGSSN